MSELAPLSTVDDLLAWATASLPIKNTLLAADARAIEEAYRRRLELAVPPLPSNPPQQERLADAIEAVTEPLQGHGAVDQAVQGPASQEANGSALAFPKGPPRKRSKAHLSFVRSQPCLVCKQTPSDAHHLKFAQPRALGRKVSDEFTVPLCRSHHQALHRQGNEKAWWVNQQISPLPVASELWACSPIQEIGNTSHEESGRLHGFRKGSPAGMNG